MDILPYWVMEPDRDIEAPDGWSFDDFEDADAVDHDCTEVGENDGDRS